MANNPQIPNYKPGVGRLVTDRYDFEKHIDGAAFRHNATQIDIANPSETPGGATTVESALDFVATFIAQQSGVGEGFITVGDGYDTYHAANGNVNYDSSIPSLDVLLNPIFASITAYQTSGTPVSPAYERIQNGGIIVIKSGTYIVQNTINVPPGIILLGEGYGTKIVNATSLTLSQTPSLNVLGTPQPVFKILTNNAGIYPARAADGAPSNNDKLMFASETRIVNMVICDNFVEPAFIGDSQYLQPQNRTTLNPAVTIETPLIFQQAGSSLVLDGVFIIGRAGAASYTTGGQTYAVTQYYTTMAHSIDTSITAPSGTRFRITDSIVDGVGAVTLFEGYAGSNDYLEVSNCKIRSYGWNFLGSQFAFIIGDNNVKIVNNTIYCEGFSYTGLISGPPTASALQSLILLTTLSASTPTLQGRSKILIASNNINVDKIGTGVNTAFTTIYNAGTIPTYATSLAYGNSLNGADGFDIEVDGAIVLTSNSASTIVANLTATAANITNATITSETVTTSTVTNETVTNFSSTNTSLTGSVYNNVNALTSAIASTNNTVTPMQITVSVPNMFSSTDVVFIAGNNLGVNGLWTLTAISSTVYSLNNSTATNIVTTPTQGTITAVSHKVSAFDFMILAPNNTYPLLSNTTSGNLYGDGTGFVSALAPTGTIAAQGAALIGQTLMVSAATSGAYNGTYTITGFHPAASSSTCSISTVAPSPPPWTFTLTGAPSGTFTSAHVGQFITTTGASYSTNNTTASKITAVNSDTSVTWIGISGGTVGPDPNNGSISFSIRPFVTYTDSSNPDSVNPFSNDTGTIYFGPQSTSIILPSIVSGRNLIIKDIGGAGPTTPILLVAQSGQFFDLTSSSTYSLVTPSISVSLIGYGSQWYIV